MQPRFELRGVQDVLQVYEDRLTITPKGVLGFFNKGLKGTKEIPFRSIVAVQFRAGGAIVSGYLQFTIAGGNESKGGVFSATQDENTFMFVKAANAAAEEIKAFIDSKVNSLHASGPSGKNEESLTDKIRELAALKEQGLLSDDEFTAAKAKLLL